MQTLFMWRRANMKVVTSAGGCKIHCLPKALVALAQIVWILRLDNINLKVKFLNLLSNSRFIAFPNFCITRHGRIKRRSRETNKENRTKFLVISL